MRKENRNKQIYFALYTFAALTAIFLLELSQQLDFSMVHLLGKFGIDISGKALITTIDFVTHWAFFGFLYIIVYWAAEKIVKFGWAIKHSDRYIDGAWLHIHDKGNVRVGVVNIEQDFYEIKVEAENNRPNTQHNRITNWHYIGAEFDPDTNTAVRLLACYYAQRTGEASKQGVHIFDCFKIEELQKTTKDMPLAKKVMIFLRNLCKKILGLRVYKMIGYFGDVILAEQGGGSVNANDKVGEIILIKMTKEIKDYISYKSVSSYDNEKLAKILTASDVPENVKNSEYVRTLREICNKNDLQLLKSQLNEKLKEMYVQPYSAQIQTQYEKIVEDIETAIYYVILCAMHRDGRVDSSETEALERLTGIIRTPEQCDNVDKKKIKALVSQIIDTIGNNEGALSKFRSILRHSCKEIVRSNLEVTLPEEQFLALIEEITSA